MKTRSKHGELETGLTNHFYVNQPDSDKRTHNLRSGAKPVVELHEAKPKDKRSVAHDRVAYLLGHEEVTYREPRRPWWFLLQEQQDTARFETQLIHPLTNVTHWRKREDGSYFDTLQPESTYHLITECLNIISSMLSDPFRHWAPVKESDPRHPVRRSGKICWPLLYPMYQRTAVNTWSWGPCMVYSKDKVHQTDYAYILDDYLYLCVGAQRQTRKNSTTTAGVIIGAHRLLAWAMYGPPTHRDQVVIHTCDNKRCLHPAHLKYASQRENLKLAQLTRNKRRRRDDWNIEQQSILDGLSGALCDHVDHFPLCNHSFRIVKDQGEIA